LDPQARRSSGRRRHHDNGVDQAADDGASVVSLKAGT